MQISMVILSLQSFFLSLSSCSSNRLCLYFHPGIIEAHCLYCWSSIKMIHRLAGDFFIWLYCCSSISVSLLIHPRNLFWTDAAVCADIYFTYAVVCLPSLQLCYVWKVTLSFCHRQMASNVKHDNGGASLRNNAPKIKAQLKSFPHMLLMFFKKFHARITKGFRMNIRFNLSSSFVRGTENFNWCQS